MYKWINENMGKTLAFADMHTDEDKYGFVMAYYLKVNDRPCFSPFQAYNRATASANYIKLCNYPNFDASVIKISLVK